MDLARAIVDNDGIGICFWKVTWKKYTVFPGLYSVRAIDVQLFFQHEQGRYAFDQSKSGND